MRNLNLTSSPMVQCSYFLASLRVTFSVSHSAVSISATCAYPPAFGACSTALLSDVGKYPISFSVQWRLVYKIWPLLKSPPSPLFMFMVGWISNCEIEILKWFRGDLRPHTPFYLRIFTLCILHIIWSGAYSSSLTQTNIFFFLGKCLISDLRKREVLLGAAINFWLRLAT